MDVQADLSHHWAYMSEDTLSDVAAQLYNNSIHQFMYSQSTCTIFSDMYPENLFRRSI